MPRPKTRDNTPAPASRFEAAHAGTGGPEELAGHLRIVHEERIGEDNEAPPAGEEDDEVPPAGEDDEVQPAGGDDDEVQPAGGEDDDVQPLLLLIRGGQRGW